MGLSPFDRIIYTVGNDLASKARCNTPASKGVHIVQAIEFETTVDPKGNLHFPEKYRDVYGKHVRLMVLSTAESLPGKTMDPMKYSNTLDWPVDGLDYQKQARGEWE